MANQEHLDILKQGVDAWNTWRNEHPDVQPDLSHANLRKFDLYPVVFLEAGRKPINVNLSHANLREADFGDASLLSADFSYSDLRGAYLGGANLSKANFSYANLSTANLIQSVSISNNFSYSDLSYAAFSNALFYMANLSSANLHGADLSQAHFLYCDLQGANISEATLGLTTFGDVDLRAAKGLETVKHTGPSVIGTNTLLLLRDSIPEVFLQKAGVIEEFITFAQSLFNKPIEFYSCFISYSSQDQDFAERLYADLQSKGVRCWFAPEDMKIGDRIRDRIDESIRLYDKLLLILSEHSVMSEWVEDEVEAALERERLARGQGEERTVLFPVRLDDVVKTTVKAWAAKLRRQRYIGDFTKWKEHDEYQKAFNRLLHDLQAKPSRRL